MRKTIVFICLFLLFVNFNGISKKLPFAVGDYPPYIFKEGPKKGFCIDIVDAVCKEMGYTPEYTFYPWSRAEFVTENGEVWAVFPYFYTEERAKKYNFSDVFLTTKTKLFYYGDKFKKFSFRKLTDLKKVKVGGAQGYWYIEEFKKAGITLDISTGEDQAIKKLHAGRIELLPLDELSGWNYIESLFPDDKTKFGTLKKEIKIGEARVMVSKKYPKTNKILKDFNKALKKVMRSGKYDKILSKYKL